MSCLRSAYKDHISDFVDDGETRDVVMRNGTRIPWDDGEEKGYEALLAGPDMEDQLAMRYPKGRHGTPPEAGQDPGRVRVEAFFEAIYGESKAAVQANLVKVRWLPGPSAKPVQFNRRAGAAEALSRVSEQLDKTLPQEMIRYVTPLAGTFNFRTIAGTNRLSAHAFGIAVDINPRYGDYWRWRPGRSLAGYRNQIPWEIVEIFEAHGFIWGGKWHHFDTLHFEYRPELLASPCLQQGE